MHGNGRGRRCNLSQVWLRVCGSVWLPVEGSGGIEQAMKAVAQECWQFLSLHGGRFSCVQDLETKLPVSRVDAVRVLEWFGGTKQFPPGSAGGTDPFSRCTSASKRSWGPEGRPAVFESQLYRSVQRTLCD